MLIVVQPWFTAIGHPAQSLVNTARAIGPLNDITYMVSAEKGNAGFDQNYNLLSTYAHVVQFHVKKPSLREGTIKALFCLIGLAISKKKYTHIFFFDAHLALLAVQWIFLGFLLRPKKLSVIYLMGPERISRSHIVAWIVRRFLEKKEVVLYLRTEELVAAWRKAFPTVLSSSIRYLPSLELSDSDPQIKHPLHRQILKFGVFGQIRHGKGLDWLVPMFQQQPELGELTVAGTFNSPQDINGMAYLKNFDGFRNEYLSDEAMLDTARQQHYLLMLYDNWDARMESAVLYLAARAGRPVIAFDKGWCGRQIAKYGNGLLVPQNCPELPTLFKSLPFPDSEEYSVLLSGVERFRQAHSVKRLREYYLQELMN